MLYNNKLQLKKKKGSDEDFEIWLHDNFYFGGLVLTDKSSKLNLSTKIEEN